MPLSTLMSKIITLESFIYSMQTHQAAFIRGGISHHPPMAPGKLEHPLVSTNGCFDILHAGHVAYLQKAASFGAHLLVLVNSDDSVTRLKGVGRPFVKLEHRMMVLAALESVSYVVLFEEDTPEAALEFLYRNGVGPSVHVKGGDYTVPESFPVTLDTVTGGREEEIKKHYSGFPEAEVVHRYGCEVKVIPFEHGISTSAIVDRIRTNRYLRKEVSDQDAETSQGR